jgi:hypothetical protein
MESILNFFETIGLLVRRGYLDIHDVWDCFSYWMFNVYADAHEIIKQEQEDDASYFSDFSALIEKLRVVEEKEGGTDYPPSSEDIEEFWKYELEVIPGKATRKRRSRRGPGKSGDAT